MELRDIFLMDYLVLLAVMLLKELKED